MGRGRIIDAATAGAGQGAARIGYEVVAAGDAVGRRHAVGLAWYFGLRVLMRDWRSLLVTLSACAIAGVIATFQYSVYISFLTAASVAPRAIAPQLWIVPAGVECFDFPDRLGEDYSAAIQGVAPDARVRRVAFGFVPWRSPTGRRSNVALVGVDDLAIPPTGFMVDQSDLRRLDLEGAPADQSFRGSIGDQSVDFAGTRRDLATFLGVPYVLVRFDLARQILRMDPSTASYLAVDLPPGQAMPDLRGLSQRYSELAFLTASQFEQSSAHYWQRRTGAGLAILLAAGLATVLMVFLLANGIVRFIQQYQRDFLSLVGHGAGSLEIGLIVAVVTAAVLVAVLAISAIAAPLLTIVVRPLLPWVSFHPTDLVVPGVGVALAFVAALLWARRILSGYGPEAVFRV